MPKHGAGVQGWPPQCNSKACKGSNFVVALGSLPTLCLFTSQPFSDAAMTLIGAHFRALCSSILIGSVFCILQWCGISVYWQEEQVRLWP